MYCVYVLQSLKDQRTYVGYTDSFERRFEEHNTGRSLATKNRRPFIVLFVENFQNKNDAKKRELYWKNRGGRRKLKKLFLNKHH